MIRTNEPYTTHVSLSFLMISHFSSLFVALGIRHGKGLVKFPNGDTYHGDFRNGMRDGETHALVLSAFVNASFLCGQSTRCL